jgi:uncharacterized cupredoxin-like copper-binding protein
MRRLFFCRRSLLVSLAALPLAACGKPPAVTLRIASKGEDMLFTPDRLSCPAGAAVTLIFHHSGTISHDPHDWVLLKPGTRDRFLAVSDRAPDGSDGVTAGNRDMVLARTPPCPMGGTVEARFVAPSSGNYDFVCSIPGHGETMHGILTTS